MGETIRLHFEYEVIAPVPSLAFLFRLYLPSDDAIGQQIVTDIVEVLSKGALDAGQRGSFDLTLPNNSLLPNEFSIYAVLMPYQGKGAFDVIDTNVQMPVLAIAEREPQPERWGVVAVDYRVEQRAPSMVTKAKLAVRETS